MTAGNIESLGNLFGYQGRPVDPETGLVYFRNRYYDPELARFITADPLGYVDGPSQYIFGVNSPATYSDPLGLASDWTLVDGSTVFEVRRRLDQRAQERREAKLLAEAASYFEGAGNLSLEQMRAGLAEHLRKRQFAGASSTEALLLSNWVMNDWSGQSACNPEFASICGLEGLRGAAEFFELSGHAAVLMLGFVEAEAVQVPLTLRSASGLRSFVPLTREAAAEGVERLAPAARAFEGLPEISGATTPRPSIGPIKNLSGDLDGAAQAARTYYPRPASVNQNSLHHIFGQPKHNLEGLVKAYGSQENAYTQLLGAMEQRVQGAAGRFDTVVRVGGFDITVRGVVIDGQVQIGTAFIP